MVTLYGRVVTESPWRWYIPMAETRGECNYNCNITTLMMEGPKPNEALNTS